MTSAFSTVKEKFTDRNLWKKAVRLGLQSSVAAAVLFVVMQYFELPEKFVGVLSAVLVVAPGIGGTLSKAKDRFLSTVVGCIVGSVGLLALPGGYGTAVGLAVSILLMNLLVGFFPDWRYGIVAAVALALGSDGDVWQTAFDRCFAIGLGVVIGTTASLVVWPEKSSTRADHSLQAAIKALIDYFNLTLDSAVENEGERDGGQIRDQFTTCIANAKDAVKHVNLADSSGIESRIEAVERIFGAVSILRRVRGEEGRDVNELLEEKLSSEVSRVKETFDSVFDLVVAGKGLDKADSPEELKEAIREMEDNFELKGSTENKEKTKAYTLLFSLSEIVEGVEAYRDAG